MAILPEAAVRWAKAQGTPEALRNAVCQRLLAADAAPVGDGRLDEFPEDVVIALLESEEVEREVQHFTAAGWDDARRTTERILTDPTLGDDERKALMAPFLRVYRVAELSESSLLRGGVRAALHLAMECPDIETALHQQVVAAAMSYLSETDRPTWKHLLERESVAGLAFLALLEIDPGVEDIPIIFRGLLEKQFVDGWKIDVWFLGEYVRTYTGSTVALEEALREFRSQWPQAWDAVKEPPDDNPCWPADVFGRILGEHEEASLVKKGNPSGGSASA